MSSDLTNAEAVGRGRVQFVGAGPGDPNLLTLAAVAALEEAAAVLLDSDDLRALLAHPQVRLATDATVTTTGAPGVRRVLCPNPSAFTFRGTNTYLIGRGSVAVLDPGPDDPVHGSAAAEWSGWPGWLGR